MSLCLQKESYLSSREVVKNKDTSERAVGRISYPTKAPL
jgi:hypothetical protein